MPFIPELFSFPVLERVQARRRAPLRAIPFFDGLLTGEIDALVGSFAGEPEVHHPVRGRIKGTAAFARFVSDTTTWLAEHHVEIEDGRFVLTPSGGVEEFVLHLDDGTDMAMAIAADVGDDDRMTEVRIYSSGTGSAGRPPLLQPDPSLRLPDIVGDHQSALTRGDVDAVVATFEPDGTVGGTGEISAYYQRMLSDGGGLPLEQCSLFDDGQACALECNMVAADEAEPVPRAAITVFVRGSSGKLAAVRTYDHRPERRSP